MFEKIAAYIKSWNFKKESRKVMMRHAGDAHSETCNMITKIN